MDSVEITSTNNKNKENIDKMIDIHINMMELLSNEK